MSEPIRDVLLKLGRHLDQVNYTDGVGRGNYADGVADGWEELRSRLLATAADGSGTFVNNFASWAIAHVEDQLRKEHPTKTRYKVNAIVEYVVETESAVDAEGIVLGWLEHHPDSKHTKFVSIKTDTSSEIKS